MRGVADEEHVSRHRGSAHAGNAIFDAVNVQAALGYLDLLSLQVADLRGSEAMSIGDQDHGCVAMPVAAVTAPVHQPLDLALGETQ